MEYRNTASLKPHPISVKLYGENHLDDEFIDSIRQRGILTPLTINDKDMIISGHRRWRVATQLAILQVPVEIRHFEDELQEKLAILDYNRYREKTFSQKMNEAELVGEIVSVLNDRAKQERKPLVQLVGQDTVDPRPILARLDGR